MKYCYLEDFRLTYSQMDPNMHLNLFSAASISQDLITKLFALVECDNIQIALRRHAVWVIAKTRMHINHMPPCSSTVHTASVFTHISPYRVEMESRFTNDKDELLMVVRQLLCPISMETRKPITIYEVDFPENAEPDEKLLEDPYLRMRHDFSAEEPVFRRTVRSSDIDFSRHFNNCMAIKYVYDTRPVAYWDTHRLTDFEVLYIAETLENEKLSVYAAELEDGTEYLLRTEEHDCIRAWCRTEEKENRKWNW